MKQKLIKSNWYVGVASELTSDLYSNLVFIDSEFSVTFGFKYTLDKWDWTIIDLI